MVIRSIVGWLVLVCIAMSSWSLCRAAGPMRPLPRPSQHALSDGDKLFVDARRGGDENDGSQERPWKTINHALQRAAPGVTVYLRGGVYFEHVVVRRSGVEGAPITLASMPGQVAVIDGGLPEFQTAPGESWVPFEGGAEHEFVSTKTYPEFNQRNVVSIFPAAGWEPFYGKEDERPLVLGHFMETMTPLHGYRTALDLRDTSMLWDVTNKLQKDEGIHCGPGVWFNRETERIHVRLAHTNLPGLGDNSYRGETDPRKVPLSISGPFGADVLRINSVKHIEFRDIALRGAAGSPLINLYGSDHVTLDGVTVFGGSPGLLVKATSNLKIVNCAFRGLAAPWSSRASMKYRGTPSYRIISQRNKPESHDCEISYSEFTDDHDGVWVRYIRGLRFHHNYVDNFNDDGIEFGARKRDHEIYVYQNLISRCLLTLTLHEMDGDESPPEVDAGSGVFITRNVIDLRRGVFKTPPRENDDSGAYLNQPGTLCGDHGGPIWPNYFFYHNTVVRTEPAWRGYYGLGIGGRATRGTTRRVINNIFCQLKGVPGLNFAPGADDTLVDGNLHWGILDGPQYQGDYFEREGRGYAYRKAERPAAWMANDQFGDPKFSRLDAAPDGLWRPTLKADSPAVKSGVAIPEQWFDPLREAGGAQPDLGAIPLDVKPWSVGIRGRISLGSP
ncbi:MAG: right-handed parallel beta-helix repeat-containing protein [Pirellulaceae bacterium]|nr:right-handed parallel beta-helix repeat-containing protein [Pirellulaceae bacterium]